MRLLYRRASALFLGAMLLLPGAVTACSRNNSYYDPAYSDYHRWDSREDAAYRRWEAEQRVEHLEYQRRSAEQQRTYWQWRHAHPDRD